MSKLLIFIPSSKRASRQTTFENLPPSIQRDTKIVVPVGEGGAYKKYPHVEVPVKGIGPTRQWCLEQGKKVVMLDDDLTFATRRKDDPTKFLPADPAAVEFLFDEISQGLDHYAHVGVGCREGGNYKTEHRYEVGRMLRILAYHTPTLDEHKIRFDELEVMEDFDVTLSLLKKGYKNFIINWIVHNQNGSNLSGGCSQYRTLETQARAALALAKKHSPFVSVVEKETKTAWGGGVRTDFRIQWRKAYDSSQ